MSRMNRLGNINNEYQGSYKRVLCLCSAGLLRSPTAALVLSQEPYNYNTRAAGTSMEFALIQVDDVLLKWADEIVCMEQSQKRVLDLLMHKDDTTPIIVLHISDEFKYRQPELMELIAERYEKFSKQPKEPIITKDK